HLRRCRRRDKCISRCISIQFRIAFLKPPGVYQASQPCHKENGWHRVDMIYHRRQRREYKAQHYQYERLFVALFSRRRFWIACSITEPRQIASVSQKKRYPGERQTTT